LQQLEQITKPIQAVYPFRRRRANDHDYSYFRTVFIVSVSAAVLSDRYRFTRANRSAMPLAYRGLI
jgi:hypothetical protein